jgi:hypothetical protein
MTSIENNNVIVNTVTETVVVKVKAKAFAQKDKKTLYSIMGFMMLLKEQGVLEEDKVIECLEALPLYKTAAEKTAFFEQEVFDTKKVEDELYKPMVLDYKKAKKEKRQVKKEKKEAVEGEVKVKKPRVKKVKENENEEPKRGRKPKQQIVELAQEGNKEEEKDPLDLLIQSMNQKEETSVSVAEPVGLEEINVEDVDDILKELEAEEIVETKPKEETTVPVVKEKKEKKKKEDTEVKEKEVKVKKVKKVTVSDETKVVVDK